jgi:hypothetical protein
MDTELFRFMYARFDERRTGRGHVVLTSGGRDEDWEIEEVRHGWLMLKQDTGPRMFIPFEHIQRWATVEDRLVIYVAA